MKSRYLTLGTYHMVQKTFLFRKSVAQGLVGRAWVHKHGLHNSQNSKCVKGGLVHKVRYSDIKKSKDHIHFVWNLYCHLCQQPPHSSVRANPSIPIISILDWSALLGLSASLLVLQSLPSLMSWFRACQCRDYLWVETFLWSLASMGSHRIWSLARHSGNRVYVLHCVATCWVCLCIRDTHGIRVGNMGVYVWCFIGVVDFVIQGYGKVGNGSKVRKVCLWHQKGKPDVFLQTLDAFTDRFGGLPLGVVRVKVQLLFIHGLQFGLPQFLDSSVGLSFIFDVKENCPKILGELSVFNTSTLKQLLSH